MKYEQPYGVSDPNAPYINGNPATGQMGSIPPAASIENPQREIVNLIADAGITPSDADLHQLAKGVQSGFMIYGDDTGAANQISIAASPPVTALQKGMFFHIKFAHDNTGPASASISGLPFVQIVHAVDGSPLVALDIRAGSIGCIAFDGTNFQLVWLQAGVAGAPGAPPPVSGYLTRTMDYYVGGPGASDLNDGTSPTVTTGTTGPWATLQHAQNVIAAFNLNGHDINVHIHDGNYASVILMAMTGSGNVNWIGNPTTPGNVVITGTSVNAIHAYAAGRAHKLNGLAVQTSGSFIAGQQQDLGMMNGLLLEAGTSLDCRNMQYNTCAGSQIACIMGSILVYGDKQIINGNALGNNPMMPYGWHIYCELESIVQVPPDTSHYAALVLTGNWGGYGFILAGMLSGVNVLWSSISGGGTWGGYKYQANMNSVILVNGNGQGYFPGTISGITNTGGVYN